MVAIWNHRNTVSFKGQNCNTVSILDYAMQNYHSIMLYNKRTNNLCLDNDTCKKSTAWCSKQNNKS